MFCEESLLEGVYYMRPGICLLFIMGEMKWNFVLEVIGVKGPIKNGNKPRRDIEASISEATMQAFMEEVLC